MSGLGSPSDHAAIDTTNTDGTVLASADTTVADDKTGSGDANLTVDASSASDDKGATKVQPKPTLHDVLKVAASLDENGKPPAPANDGKVEAVIDPNAPVVEKTEAQKAEDDAKLPFHKHPRWMEVTGQNKTLQEKVATLEPAATQFGKITEFMQTHNLTHEETGEGFIIMAMLKAGDPRGLAKLDEYRDKLATALGEKIPADIQAQIDSGAINEEAGKELSKARAGKTKSDADAATLRDANSAREKTDAATRLANECQAGVTAWDREARKTDPDFAKKESAISRYSRALMQEKGFPKTAAAAVAIVKEAYAQVNKDFAAALPQKTPVTHVASAPSSHGAKPAPKTLAQAVKAGIG